MEWMDEGKRGKEGDEAVGLKRVSREIDAVLAKKRGGW